MPENRSAQKTLSPVAITGFGIVSPFGIGAATLENALRSAECCIRKSAFFPELKGQLLISEIDSFDLPIALEKLYLPTNQVEKLKVCLGKDSLSQQAAVLAAVEAYQHAGLDRAPIDSKRIGLIIAGGNLSQSQQWQKFQEYRTSSISFTKPSWALKFLDSYLLSIISDALQLNGPGITASAASASSHAALMQALQWIKLDIVDACFVVGAMTELSALEWQSLINLGALGGYSFKEHPEYACRPFDFNHEGFIPGQAAACVVLESDICRVKRGIESHGELLSVVMGMDGSRLAEPSLEGEVRVMCEALAQAQIDMESINYINAHGTSTPKGDEIELQAINVVFSNKNCMPWINSTKGIMGHCLWSAGIVELIAILLQMKHGFVHGNRNLDSPINNKCNLVGKQQQKAAIKYALSNAFGFGGINSSLVVGNI